VIGHLLALVLVAGVSLRAAARCCVLAAACLRGPDPATGRLWLLRLGGYRLSRPVEPATDWCWLLDHTALLGRQRLLAVLGVRLTDWAVRASRGEGTLTLADVRVLHLAAVEDPDAAAVGDHLQQLAQRAGVPRAIVSDHGADVWAGIRRFRQDRPAVAELCDAKHFAANRLKGLLQRQPQWAAFQAALGRTRAALQQTEWAFVVPPTLRTKSRYLNLDVLLSWAAKGQALLALPPAERAARGDVERLEQALGWLRELAPALAEWGEWLAVTQEVVRSVRSDGLHARSADELAGRLGALAQAASSRELAGVLVDFVRQQQSAAQAGERLLGSTEVLESLFGRLKALQRDQSRGGVTALALALPALAGPPSAAEVGEALARYRTADVRAWVAEHLSPNLQAQRCWLRSLLPKRSRPKRKKNGAKKACGSD
jgi:hypothetical protein